MIAAQLPDLPEVLANGHAAGWAYVCLDGTLISSTRSSAKSDAGHDLWYSGKHKRHGRNIQVVTDPVGSRSGSPPVEPGSTHDLSAARLHVLPALYPAAAAGMPTLADKGLRRRRNRDPRPIQGRQPLPRQPDAEPPDQRSPRARRTRQRSAEIRQGPAPRHSLPLAHRRHHRRRARHPHDAPRAAGETSFRLSWAMVWAAYFANATIRAASRLDSGGIDSGNGG